MSEYRVLARKYRPKDFDDLIGQEVLVRTLSNAITQNRLAHAFLLTGIRGIGKTTTARIIAKALNCIGIDGNGGPTIRPCGECGNCLAIAQDRHIDVMEMDAASRTGVDDIRDLIETVHYAPTNARYKIYIIDEVHMLSKNAFNALLKTLEEPPAHVKFVFATTELRKIPVTILSRCQRFDLKRIERDELAVHLGNICQKEAVTADAEALSMIATAAEGSVRDALSLLDQSIAQAGDGEGGALHILQSSVAEMLGLSDKTRNYTLLNSLFSGDLDGAITLLHEQYAAGSDPMQLIQEMLEIIHEVTLLKANQKYQNASAAPEQQAVMQSLAAKLPMTLLTRSWQMLLKGLQECQLAPNPLMAAEMILIRLAHLSDLPSPEELIRKLRNEPTKPLTATTPVSSHGSSLQAAPVAHIASVNHSLAVASSPALRLETAPQTAVETGLQLADYDAVLALFEQKKEVIIHRYLEREASVVNFSQGAIELNFTPMVPMDIPGKVAQYLTEWTGQRWMISLSQLQGQPTRYAIRQQKEKELRATVEQHPLVSEAMALFPGAIISKIETGADS